METTQNEIITPVRLPVLVPAQPTPQTVQGTLEHTGDGIDSEDIKDVPLSFSFFNSIPYFLTTFDMKSTDLVGDEILKLNVYQDNSCGRSITQNSSPPWVGLPMLGSTYFNGAPKFRMFAVKPSRTPAKLLVEFWYIPSGMGKEIAKRTPLREWDLQESPVCEFSIPGAYVLRDKTSIIPTQPKSEVADFISSGYETAIQNYEAGQIRVTVAMPYQPGSLFPDTFPIYVEKSWPDTVFKIPNSFRGNFANPLQSSIN